MIDSIPVQVRKYFWGDDLNQLNWQDHSQYIIQTLLDKGDTKSISWLFKKTNPNHILNMLPLLKLSSKTRNFWQVYLT
ncbi:hypothetical protein KJ953_01170 [Patescibacteria group bacterium]|nr:hypothetical protein [Patescibacteria group bacterium]MBU1256124.1 hypothetical protein [Patescibacteria group bacterium]MBU1457636.1 hypothetical protein [Patescibacteria group bacterium]